MQRVAGEVEQNDATKKRKLFPLDQSRIFIGKYTDTEGYTHKQYELTNPNDESDKIQIELMIKDPSDRSLEVQTDLKVTIKQTDVEAEVNDVFPDHSFVHGTRVFARNSLSHRFRELIEHTNIVDVSLHDNSVVFASDKESVGEVFNKMVKNKFISLPIYNEENRFAGFVDILDILRYLTDKLVDLTTGPFENISWWATWHSVDNVSKTPCKQIINISKRNPNFCAVHDMSVQKVLDDMGVFNIHRIGILKEKTLVGILTQSKLLEFFFKHDFLTDIGNIAVSTVGQLRLGYRKVHSITLETKVISAFRAMIENHVSGLAVLHDNEIVGNISASDIKELGFEFNLFSRLFVSIKEFFGENMKPLQSVTPQTKFKDVVTLFLKNKVHRVYVVDEKDVVGVITPSDILKCFQTKPHNPFGVNI